MPGHSASMRELLRCAKFTYSRLDASQRNCSPRPQRAGRTASKRIEQIAFRDARRQIKLPVSMLPARNAACLGHALEQCVVRHLTVKARPLVGREHVEEAACARSRERAALRYRERPALHHDETQPL